LEGSSDEDDALVQVDVVPAKGEGFTAAQPEGEGDCVEGVQPVGTGRLESLLGFLASQRREPGPVLVG
jgi:hypothetical protein